MRNEQGDLLELVHQASESAEGLVRMDAVRRLKRRAVSQLDAIALAEFARKAEDPGWRTTAAQVLGYHRAAERFPDLVDPLTTAVSGERDPEARRAIVFSLRGTTGSARLLNHGLSGVSGEAVMGLPQTTEGLEIALDAYFAGLVGSAEHQLLTLVCDRHDAPERIVEYLMCTDFPPEIGDPTDRARLIVTHLDQGRVVGALLALDEPVERMPQAIWPGIARRERRRVLIELFAETVQDFGASEGLADGLAKVVAGDDGFWNSRTRAVKWLLAALAPSDAGRIATGVVAAMRTAPRDAHGRLGELLMQVARASPSAGAAAREALDAWPSAPQEVRARLIRVPN